MTRNLGPELGSHPGGIAGDLILAIEGYVEAVLEPYITHLREVRSPTDKTVNDAVWGTIRLFPWEVAVVDSPIMQRLRGLRQLGVIHWVYPSANHSRFEHSIGALHQAQALLDAVERSSGRVGTALIGDADAKLIRLTALLHDCGHVVFSHVGERHLRSHPEVVEAGAWIAEQYQADAPAPSEYIAALILRSPAFVALLGEPRVAADFISCPETAARQMAGLVLGAPGVLDQGFLADLISGPYDADKLDYMVRDAQMAGLPAAVDVSRITDKLQAVYVEKESCSDAANEALARHRHEQGHVLALPPSGTTVLRELARARASLYEKMYYHHKVRALECVADRVLAEHHDRHRSTRPLWWLEDSDEFVIAGSQGPWSLRWRRLPERASFIPPPHPEEEVGGPTELAGFWSLMHVPAVRRKVNEEIAQRSEDFATLLGAQLRARPQFDFPDWKRARFKEGALIGDAAGELHSPSVQATGERSKTAEVYARDGALVFASSQDLEVVHWAVASVLAERGVAWRPELVDRTNLDRNRLATVGNRLRDAGATLPDWEERPVPVIRRTRPMENFLRSAWSRILVLGSKFGPYQALRGHPVNSERVAYYLRQFETVGRARSMLRVLESVRLLGRKDFGTALRSALAQCRERSGKHVKYICPLGSSGDSSAWVSYFIGDLQDVDAEVLPIELALERGPEAILLWDDFCGRSGHAVTTLRQWAGDRIGDPVFLLNEALGSRLSDSRWDALQHCEVFVGFASARPAGLTALRTYLSDSALDFTVLEPGISIADHDGFLDDDTVISDPAMRDELREFLVERMRQVWGESGWTTEKIEDRLLGYGNHQHRLVFFYNVPTVTLSPLWAGREHVWLPLFPRRKKIASSSDSTARGG